MTSARPISRAAWSTRALASGTNEYHANGFYSQSTDGLQGDNIQGIKINLPKYKSETYGGTVSGPIIKDKLFIAGSYERNTDPRPLTPGSVAQVPNLTQDQVNQIQQIAKTVYNYTTGDILPVTNNLDEKFSVKIDWNITDGQRFSLSYVNSYDAQDNPQNSSTSTTAPSIGLASNAYKLTELLRVGIAQLNSDWSDRFSTEARFSYKAYTRGQDPELGRGFAQFTICTAPTSVVNTAQGNTLVACGLGNPTVSFGPDLSRQTNALFTDTYDGSFVGRFKAGNHDFKALVQYVENRTTNAFLQRSAGVYYFDSIADFQNRTASQFDYANALTLNPDDTTASFKYGEYSVGIQDDWQLLPNFRLTGGLRYNLYASSDPVGLNNSFVARYGFPNTNTFNGLQAFEPRLSFDWKPVSNLKLRGGVGIFAAGTPDIYFSNSYSNTGANQNRIASVIRATPTGGNALTCTAPYTGANAAICTAALNNVQGTLGTIPAAVNTFLTSNIGSLATAGTASVDPRFRVPSQTRATLSADYKLFGIDFGADYLFSKVNSGVTFTDLRSVRIGTLPDGRARYSFLPTPGVVGQTVDTNSDIQITNTRDGRSHIFVLRAEKEFKSLGITINGSYTWQDVKDVSNATSSVAASLYNAQAVIDPNNAAYGISSDQIKWQFKYGIGYDHAWFRDYRTIIQLFGETRAGRPYSFTAQDTTAGRSAVFGTLGNNNHYLLYVPTSTTDPLVSYDNTTTRDSLETLINNTALKNYRGAIAAKNIARSRANTRIDLHLEQEIPTFIGKSRISVYADIENLPNLLNRDWGGVTQLAFPATATIVQVACLNAAVATGTPVGNIGATPPAGGVAAVNTNSTQACAQYRYSAYRDASQTLTNDISLYLIRLGVRVKF